MKHISRVLLTAAVLGCTCTLARAITISAFDNSGTLQVRLNGDFYEHRETDSAQWDSIWGSSSGATLRIDFGTQPWSFVQLEFVSDTVGYGAILRAFSSTNEELPEDSDWAGEVDWTGETLLVNYSSSIAYVTATWDILYAPETWDPEVGGPLGKIGNLYVDDSDPTEPVPDGMSTLAGLSAGMLCIGLIARRRRHRHA